MMKEDSYFKQVNWRLAGARFLLLSLDTPTVKTNRVGQQALMESALLQFYFAVFAYLNELLQYYRRPQIDASVLDLSSVLSEHARYFEGVSEFAALQKWSQDNDNILLKLAAFPSGIMELKNEKKESAQAVQQEVKWDDLLAANPLELIAVSTTLEELDLNNLSDVQAIKTILSGFQSLIDSQRENQLEY